MMRKYDFTSTNIRSAGWNDTRLYIQFNSGKTYVYFDVPEGVLDQMHQAESVGKFFHASIRNVYVTSQVTEAVAESLGFSNTAVSAPSLI
jgi:ribonuclease BN (tRNA processing enzyme)